jgi:hypothetical protein
MRTWQQAANSATTPHCAAAQPLTCKVPRSAQAVEVSGADAVHAEAAEDIQHLGCLWGAVAQGCIGSRKAHQIARSPGGARAVLVRQLAPHLCCQIIQQCRNCLGNSH